MKRIIAVLSCIITLIICVPDVSAAEKYLNSQDESVQIVISENGNAHITEKRKYYFGGDTITRYQRRYKKNDYILSDFCIYFDDEQMNILEDPDDSRPEGCAAIYSQNGEYCVDLYMNCLNESHWLTIEYDVLDAVVLHDECAEFRWNISSADEPTDTSRLSASIVFPFNSGCSQIEVNTLGLDNDYTQNEKTDKTSELVFYQRDLPKNEAAVVQLLLTKELFPDAKRYEKEIGSLDDSDSINNSSSDYLAPVFLLFVFLVSFIPVTIIILVILLIINGTIVSPRRFAKLRGTPSQSPENYSYLPDNLPPAIVAKLFTAYAGIEKDKYVSVARARDNSFFATLLDLTDRGVISIRKCADGFMIGLNDFYSTTYDFEKPVIEFMRNALGGKNEINDKDFEEYYANLPLREYKKFTEFSNLVNEEYKKYNFTVEFTPKKHTGIKLIAFAVLSVILSVIFFNSNFIDKDGIQAALLGVIISAAIVLTISIYIKIFIHKYVILTQEGEDRLALWKAFGRFIDDPAKISTEQLSDASMLRKFISYSLVLGRNFTFAQWANDNISYINTFFQSNENISVYLLLSNMLNAITKMHNSYGSGDGSYSSSSDCGGCCDSGGGGGCDSGSSGGSFD